MSRSEDLQSLLKLELGARRHAVCRDVYGGGDRYSAIDAFDLALALHLDEGQGPGVEQVRTAYVERCSLAEIADGYYDGMLREVIHAFQDALPEEVQVSLMVAVERVYEAGPYVDVNPALVTDEVKRALERGWAEAELENPGSAMVLADFWIPVPEVAPGAVLRFQAHVGCAGELEGLLGPYEHRAGHFNTLEDTRCAT